MSINKALGARIKELRIRRALTQEELAEKTGLSVTFIGLMERGVNLPSLKTCQKIARALGVTLDELFCFKCEDRKTNLIKSMLFKVRKASLEDITLINEVAERILEYSRQKKQK